jgi:hypothetical protein
VFENPDPSHIKTTWPMGVATLGGVIRKQYYSLPKTFEAISLIGSVH